MESKIKRGDYYTGHPMKKRISIVVNKSDLQKMELRYKAEGITVLSQISKHIQDGIKAHS